jgi:hypothetical protein
MRSLLFIAIFLTLFSNLTLAQSPSSDNLTESKRRDIHFLMELTGTSELARQMVRIGAKQLTEAVRLRDPNLPATLLTILEGEMQRMMEEELEGPDGLLEEFVPIYHRHYTHAEVKELLAFYRTPLGRKSARVTPLILRDGVTQSKAWLEEAGPRLRTKLQRRFEGLLP